jgi:hypothetical protein
MASYTNDQIKQAIEAAKAAGDTEAVTDLTAMLAQPRAAEEIQSEYGDMPWYEKLGQAVVDDARLMTHGATFGNSPGITATLHDWLGGAGDYETNKAELENKYKESATRAGNAGVVAELLGGVRSGVPIMKAGAAPVRMIGDAVEKIPAVGKYLSPIAKAKLLAEGAPGGAVIGGLTAAGQGESIPEGVVKGGAVGGALGVPLGLLGKAGGWLAGKGVSDKIGGAVNEMAEQYIGEASKVAGRDVGDALTAMGILGAEKIKEVNKRLRKEREGKYFR